MIDRPLGDSGQDKAKLQGLMADDKVMVVGRRENINRFEQDCGLKG